MAGQEAGGWADRRGNGGKDGLLATLPPRTQACHSPRAGRMRRRGRKYPQISPSLVRAHPERAPRTTVVADGDRLSIQGSAGPRAGGVPKMPSTNLTARNVLGTPQLNFALGTALRYFPSTPPLSLRALLRPRVPTWAERAY